MRTLMICGAVIALTTAFVWAADAQSCVPAYTTNPPSQPTGGMDKCESTTWYYDSAFPGKCSGDEQVAWCREDGTVDLTINYYYYQKNDDATCERVGPHTVTPESNPGVSPTKTVGQCDDSNA